MPLYKQPDYICHHGVKGQKWGIRKENNNYQKTSNKKEWTEEEYQKQRSKYLQKIKKGKARVAKYYSSPIRQLLHFSDIGIFYSPVHDLNKSYDKLDKLDEKRKKYLANQKK